MAKAKAASGTGTIQSRLVDLYKNDKSLGGVIKLGGGSLLSDVPYYVSTQCATLDYAIGRNGIPASKLTTIFGREGSCKSTLCYHILAETQAMGGIGVLIDSEQRFTRDRGISIGIDPDALLVVDGATMEQAFEAIEKVVDGIRDDGITAPVTVVYDSLAGSVTEKRMAAEVGDVLIGRAASLVNAELPRLKLKMARQGVALVVTNQVRSRIHVLDPRNASSYERIKVMGKDQTMLAEWPLIFESALMIFMASVSNIGPDKEHPTGIHARAVMRKCGIAPREFWRADFECDYLTGIDRDGSVFDLFEDLGLIKGIGGGRFTSAWDTKSFYRKDFHPTPEALKVAHDACTAWTVKTEEDDGCEVQQDEARGDGRA